MASSVNLFQSRCNQSKFRCTDAAGSFILHTADDFRQRPVVDMAEASVCAACWAFFVSMLVKPITSPGA